MKQTFVRLSIICLGLMLFNCSQTIPSQESIIDNVTHLEDSLILQLPELPRLCDAMDVEKRYVDIDDCKLYCEIEGSGLPMILISGGPGDSHHVFHPWLTEASKEFQIIYYDQRGCGLSDYNPGPGYSFEQAVNDLEKLRIALKIDKWILAGHSFGGGLAQYYTIKYPDHVLGQILIGSVAMMDHEVLRAGGTEEFYSAAETKRIAELRAKALAREINMPQYLFNRDINGGWKRSSFFKPARERIAMNGLYDFVADPAYSSDWGAYNFEDAFLTCPVPTLILEGKYDLVWSAEKRDLMAKYHPKAKLVVFETSGHNIFADEPKRFAEEIKEWSKSLENPTLAALESWSQAVYNLIGPNLELIASSNVFISLIRNSGVDMAVQKYTSTKINQPTTKLFFEAPMNALGYEYLFSDRLLEAIEIFKLTVIEYPESWNAYDSLGEAYLKNQNKALAVVNYQKSIELNPNNENGVNVLRKILDEPEG